MGARDFRNFFVYYREIGNEEELAAMANSVVLGPRYPHGTLIDFIEFYSSRSTLAPDERRNYDYMIRIIRAVGGKRESELAEAAE